MQPTSLPYLPHFLTYLTSLPTSLPYLPHFLTFLSLLPRSHISLPFSLSRALARSCRVTADQRRFRGARESTAVLLTSRPTRPEPSFSCTASTCRAAEPPTNGRAPATPSVDTRAPAPSTLAPGMARAARHGPQRTTANTSSSRPAPATLKSRDRPLRRLHEWPHRSPRRWLHAAVAVVDQPA